MKLLIRQIFVSLEHTERDVHKRASRKAGCPPAMLSDVRIIRRSLDARDRDSEPRYVMTVEAEFVGERLSKRAHRDVSIVTDEPAAPTVKRPHAPNTPRPIVVGAGPAGLMAAWQLAEAGCKPIMIERGDDAAERSKRVGRFWATGELDPESNVLYGEGGAGLFSDGKLTSRSKKRGRIQRFLEVLVECGADPDILIDATPHIGSDELLKIVPTMRRRIIERGGEVRFRSVLEQVIIDNGKLRAVVVNGEEIPCSACFLGVGHSARDTYRMLVDTGVAAEAKPFAIGVRLEIPQSAINRAQYGRFADNPNLEAASFRLTRKASGDLRSCYSFCMCPGGTVIACASEPNMLTTNGMSYSSRSLKMGNAGFLVPVSPSDFENPDSVLSGMEFQRTIESKAFHAGAGGYVTPATMLTDFLKQQLSASFPEGISCPRCKPAELRSILPDFVTRTLEHSIPRMLKEMNGVDPAEAVLYAAETRSSSPLRLLRDDTCESINTANLYPIGEGAGYAGGIVSSAIDGMRATERYIDS